MGKPCDVLISLCGLTPQVVTETLWAFAHRQPSIRPSELWVLTTAVGKEVCERTLFGKTGALARFYREYPQSRGPKMVYGPEQVIVLRGADGFPLEDVRRECDSHAVADHIAAFIREQAGRPGVQLHCSAAGGRKTMGILLASALQLYGRGGDRLYHVLVSPEFETHPDFFFKPRRSIRLHTKDGNTLATKDAVIELTEIPYVRLREIMPPFLWQTRMSLTDLVRRVDEEVQALTAHKPVHLDLVAKRLVIGPQTMPLTPAQFHLYLAFAQCKIYHCTEPLRPTCAGCSACYVHVSSDAWDHAQTKLQRVVGDGKPIPHDVEGFRSLVSKVNAVLRNGLGSERLGTRYGIGSLGNRNDKRYGIAVDKTAIREIL